jgi:hypothetical protein
MTTNPASTHETNVTAEIYPNVAAVAATYGDPQGKYAKFLNASGFPYADDASFLWDQPLAGGTLSANSNASPDDSQSHSGSSSSSAITVNRTVMWLLSGSLIGGWLW